MRVRKKWRRAGLERLEVRRLLAVDLAVTIETSQHEVIPGQEFEYVLRVTNRGEDDAEAAQVVSDATNFLENVVWTRETNSRQRFAWTDIEQLDGVKIDGKGASNGFSSAWDNVGDINGDGIDDLLVGSIGTTTPDGEGQAFVFFGSEGAQNDLSVQELDGTNGFSLLNADGGITSVSTAGDVNNDGLNDLLIGSPFDTTVHRDQRASKGVTYVVFGSNEGFPKEILLDQLDGTNGFSVRGYAIEVDRSRPSGDPNIITIGTAVGFDVASAGDFNGDGIDDILIGSAELYDRTREFANVYVVFGKATGFGPAIELSELDGENGRVIGTGAGHRPIGPRVASAGDFNGDGFDDIVVSSIGHSHTDAHVIFGDDSPRPIVETNQLDGSNGFTFRTPHVGGSGLEPSPVILAGGGDFNGDGLSDIILGSPRTTLGGQWSSGEAYVVFGSTEELPTRLDPTLLDGSNGFAMDAVQSRRHSVGGSVSVIGDVSGDGVDDILIGSSLFFPDRETHIVFGSREHVEPRVNLLELDGANGVTFESVKSPVYNGDFVGPAGDFNHDSIPDLLFATDAQAFVLFGMPAPAKNADAGTGVIDEPLNIAAHSTVTYTIRGVVPQSATGLIAPSGEASFANDVIDPDISNNRDVASVTILHERDLSVDAADGPKVAAPGDVVSFEVNVRNEGTISAPARIDGEIPDALTDVTWTRTTTRALTEYPADFLLSDLGGFTIPFMGADPRPNVLAVGDMNGDGLADLAILSDALPNEVSLVFGTTDEVTDPIGHSEFGVQKGLRIVGARGHRIGNAMSSVGDVNGDGLTDLLIANKDVTAVYLIYGMLRKSGTIDLSELDGSDGFRISLAEKDAMTHAFAPRLGGLGDVNGDGFDDFVIDVSRQRNAVTTRNGAVVYGRPAFPSDVSLASTNARSGFYFDQGIERVYSVGDVNDDGIGDIGIQLDRIPLGGQSPIFVLFGRTKFPPILTRGFLDDTVGVSIDDPVQHMAGWGASGAAAGDVNADGINDFLIGAHGDEPSYVVYNGASVILGSRDNEPEEVERVELTRLIDSGGATSSVSAVGDINGDGIDDFLIGGFGAGESYVVFGSRGILNYPPGLETLDGIRGFTIDHGPHRYGRFTAIGDFNGDGFEDFVLVARDAVRIVYAPNIVEVRTGSGEIDHLLEIGVGTTVNYRTSSRIKRNASGSVDQTLTARLSSELPTEVILDNNTTTQSISLVTPILGDIDLDGTVGFADFQILASNFGNSKAERADGDLDDDTIVGFSDFLALSANFGRMAL